MKEYIGNIKSGNSTPNLTLVLPGPCQAKCAFCSWDKEVYNNKNFLKNLEKLLKCLPSKFKQVSISGGEPTLSPVLKDTLSLLKKAKKKGIINKVVLTTNTFKLNETANLFKKVVDHVNISRHHYSEQENMKVFQTELILNGKELELAVEKLNNLGIDVNFNCVFEKSTSDARLNYLYAFINYAKLMNVSSITFRNQYDNYNESVIQKELKTFSKPILEQECPVCKTEKFLVKGMPIKFHMSSYEPTESKAFKNTNETYELILHGDGTLSKDWEKKKEIYLKKKENDRFDTQRDSLEYVSCGARAVVYNSCADLDRFSRNMKKEKEYTSCGASYSSCGN